MRWTSGCLSLILLLSACSFDKGFGPTEHVSADDYGDAWPLTAESAVLGCEPGEYIVLTIEGHSHRIDTITDPDDAHPGLKRFWAEDPDAEIGARLSLAPLVDDGTALCD
jgi:hypothetical protein